MTDLAAALQSIRDALSEAEHAVMAAELEIEEGDAEAEDSLFDDREEEIERLRRENLALRDIIRRHQERAQRTTRGAR